jgi:hypothetical protein
MQPHARPLLLVLLLLMMLHVSRLVMVYQCMSLLQANSVKLAPCASIKPQLTLHSQLLLDAAKGVGQAPAPALLLRLLLRLLRLLHLLLYLCDGHALLPQRSDTAALAGSAAGCSGPTQVSSGQACLYYIVANHLDASPSSGQASLYYIVANHLAAPSPTCGHALLQVAGC